MILALRTGLICLLSGGFPWLPAPRYIVLLCNLIPTACDLWLIFAVFVLQIIIF